MTRSGSSRRRSGSSDGGAEGVGIGSKWCPQPASLKKGDGHLATGEFVGDSDVSLGASPLFSTGAVEYFERFVRGTAACGAVTALGRGTSVGPAPSPPTPLPRGGRGGPFISECQRVRLSRQNAEPRPPENGLLPAARFASWLGSAPPAAVAAGFSDATAAVRAFVQSLPPSPR